jgi:hypothetical protein
MARAKYDHTPLVPDAPITMCARCSKAITWIHKTWRWILYKPAVQGAARGAIKEMRANNGHD